MVFDIARELVGISQPYVALCRTTCNFVGYIVGLTDQDNSKAKELELLKGTVTCCQIGLEVSTIDPDFCSNLDLMVRDAKKLIEAADEVNGTSSWLSFLYSDSDSAQKLKRREDDLRKQMAFALNMSSTRSVGSTPVLLAIVATCVVLAGVVLEVREHSELANVMEGLFTKGVAVTLCLLVICASSLRMVLAASSSAGQRLGEALHHEAKTVHGNAFAPKGDAGEGAAEDAKGRSPRKDSARGGRGEGRSGPDGGAVKAKGWEDDKVEKGEREDCQKVDAMMTLAAPAEPGAMILDTMVDLASYGISNAGSWIGRSIFTQEENIIKGFGSIILVLRLLSKLRQRKQRTRERRMRGGDNESPNAEPNMKVVQIIQKSILGVPCTYPPLLTRAGFCLSAGPPTDKLL